MNFLNRKEQHYSDEFWKGWDAAIEERATGADLHTKPEYKPRHIVSDGYEPIYGIRKGDVYAKISCRDGRSTIIVETPAGMTMVDIEPGKSIELRL